MKAISAKQKGVREKVNATFAHLPMVTMKREAAATTGLSRELAIQQGGESPSTRLYKWYQLA